MGDDTNPYRRFADAAKAEAEKAAQDTSNRLSDAHQRKKEDFDYAATPLVDVLLPELEKAKVGTAGDVTWTIGDYTDFDKPPLSPKLRGRPTVTIEAKSSYSSGAIMVTAQNGDTVKVYAPDQFAKSGQQPRKDVTDVVGISGRAITQDLVERFIGRIIEKSMKVGVW